MHLFHSWSKWEDVERRVHHAVDRGYAKSVNYRADLLQNSAYVTSVSVRQERRCDVCRKLQMREVQA